MIIGIYIRVVLRKKIISAVSFLPIGTIGNLIQYPADGTIAAKGSSFGFIAPVQSSVKVDIEGQHVFHGVTFQAVIFIVGKAAVGLLHIKERVNIVSGGGVGEINISGVNISGHQIQKIPAVAGFRIFRFLPGIVGIIFRSRGCCTNTRIGTHGLRIAGVFVVFQQRRYGNICCEINLYIGELRGIGDRLLSGIIRNNAAVKSSIHRSTAVNFQRLTFRTGNIRPTFFIATNLPLIRMFFYTASRFNVEFCRFVFIGFRVLRLI